MKNKRSSRVRLVALGTVILGACHDEYVPGDRYVYQSRQGCVQEWGETNCQSSSRDGSGYYYGPRFNWIAPMPSGVSVPTGNPDRPAINPSTGRPMSGAVNISRGGFGSTGSSVSARGG